MVLGVLPWLVVGCGDDRQAKAITSSPGGGGAAGDDSADAGAGGAPVGGAGGGGAGGGAMPSARGCSDLFDPAVLVDYAFDISADEWAKMDYEFRLSHMQHLLSLNQQECEKLQKVIETNGHSA